SSSAFGAAPTSRAVFQVQGSVWLVSAASSSCTKATSASKVELVAAPLLRCNCRSRPTASRLKLRTPEITPRWGMLRLVRAVDARCGGRTRIAMTSRRVLLIDDEDDIREVAQLSLEMVGRWEVLTARSGAEGLLMAAQDQPDAILLDVMMP